LSENASLKLVAEIMGNSAKAVLTNYAHVTMDIQKTVVDGYEKEINIHG
jgi:hypothetical protein